jgi:hypothetical protein
LLPSPQSTAATQSHRRNHKAEGNSFGRLPARLAAEAEVGWVLRCPTYGAILQSARTLPGIAVGHKDDLNNSNNCILSWAISAWWECFATGQFEYRASNPRA